MKQEKKHIVIITPGFASNEEDQYTISALQIFCKKLQEQKEFTISIITLHFPNTKEIYNWHNCTVYPLGFNNKFSKFFKGKIVLRLLSKINKENTIHYLHSFWLGECAFIGQLFSKQNNIPHLTTLMGQDAKKGNKFAKILPLKKMNLVTVSVFQQKVFLSNYAINTTVIPWGIDKNLIIPKTNKTIDIIGIGSFISLKMYSNFVKTIAILKAENEALKVTLVGDGILKPQLIKQINDFNLSETITITGMLPYKETQELLAKSKILLHPSNYESFGMVFAEALAHQTYIVSRKVGFAKASNCWRIGSSPEEFAKACTHFLVENETNAFKYLMVEETVKAYFKMYNNC